MPASISLCISQGFAGNAQEWAVRFGEKQTAVQLLNQSRTIRICRLIQTAPHYIVARGRKGGSNVAAAIVNSVLYQLVEREG